ncbi:hypothetical protein [Chitinivibrio alkaliphilus]|uniref:Uncharacterized protein n=1 Tax=Chitinivibrio alkaliphilus ACht1 TaxID=1313304 RepID=U7DDY2_9BACT|nr:hypothetical protein [Chitinivibrio alkaliphilus]ERP39116.1 hypothetical protein CALK_0282 [Chitinivibrio alkaliphilus ACht1]
MGTACGVWKKIEQYSTEKKIARLHYVNAEQLATQERISRREYLQAKKRFQETEALLREYRLRQRHARLVAPHEGYFLPAENVYPHGYVAEGEVVGQTMPETEFMLTFSLEEYVLEQIDTLFLQRVHGDTLHAFSTSHIQGEGSRRTARVAPPANKMERWNNTDSLRLTGALTHTDVVPLSSELLLSRTPALVAHVDTTGAVDVREAFPLSPGGDLFGISSQDTLSIAIPHILKDWKSQNKVVK